MNQAQVQSNAFLPTKEGVTAPPGPGPNDRVTESGIARVTEAGDIRIIE
jgi:hypothetical protein